MRKCHNSDETSTYRVKNVVQHENCKERIELIFKRLKVMLTPLQGLNLIKFSVYFEEFIFMLARFHCWKGSVKMFSIYSIISLMMLRINALS